MVEGARTRHRLTDEDVQRLLDAGLLEDRRVELIDGELVEMNPQGPVHANLTGWVRDLLAKVYGTVTHHVRDHSPVDVSPYDQPEPDVALVRKPRVRQMPHPKGEDLVLVVEIARRSVPAARAKAKVYARGKIPELWIVDTERRRLEVFRDPDGERYRDQKVLAEDDRVRWPERPDDVAVHELLP